MIKNFSSNNVDWTGRGEEEAYFVLLRGVYALRPALMVLIGAWYVSFIQAVGSVVPGVSWFWFYISGLLVLVGATVAIEVNDVSKYIRKQKYPPASHLRIGAYLDVAWVGLGYFFSGYLQIPFLPLFILLLGVHGLFLGPWSLGSVALFMGAIFVFVQGGEGIGGEVLLSEEVQATLFLAVAALSAIMGNRLRATSRVLTTLRKAMGRQTLYNSKVLDQLPQGLLLVRRQEDGSFKLESNQEAEELVRRACGRSRVTEWEGFSACFPDLAKQVLDVFSSTEGPEQEGVADRTREGYVRKVGRDEEVWYSWKVVGVKVPKLSEQHWRGLAASPKKGATWGKAEEIEKEVELAFESQALVVISDETAKRREEEMRGRAKRLEAVAELSAGLAHEIRNPIAAMRSSAEQLGEAEYTDEMDKLLIDIVVRESDRLNKLIGEFLEFARVDRVNIEEGNLLSVIRDVVTTINAAAAADKQVEIEVRAGKEASDAGESEVIPVRTELELLYRVISNLVLNAVQFTPRGGRVVIDAKSVNKQVEIFVSDEGPGIPDVDRERIFRPFYTTRKGGSGLGLAIAARAAEVLKGRLSVDASEEGKTTFRFVFPSNIADGKHAERTDEIVG